MDFVPSKIEFTNIQPAFGNKTLEEFQFNTGYPVILELDADIRIEINGICIFECPMIPILELYLQLSRWVKEEVINNFSYLSLENSNPIFQLEKSNDKWFFVSDFPQQKIGLEIDIIVFKKAVNTFLEDFEDHFKEIFDFEISTLLKSFL